MIYIELFLVFLKIGLFSVGGGLAMLPLLESELITRGWITQSQFIDMIAIAESTPGPIGINMATYVGFQTGSVLGSVIATLGVAMPSLIIIITIAHFFGKIYEKPIVRNAFYGLRPAVTGLIAAAGFSVARISFTNPSIYAQTGNIISFFNFNIIVLFVIVLVTSWKWKKHPILYIVLSGLVGIILKF